ncbi:MAG: hypothetical protein JST67_01180 [Bacteroidetes bacterium]|nr:hypothetical protein [Bacteroidota bacterium]
MKRNTFQYAIVLIAIINYQQLIGQSFTGLLTDTNFYQITNKYLQGYQKGLEDTSEGGDFESFKRWEFFWGPRLAANGSFKTAQKAYLDNISNIQSSPNSRQSSSVNSNWQPLGPYGSFGNPNQFNASGIGRINAIAFDPNYNGTTNQIMYAGGVNSGIWKYDGTQWNSLNTDDELSQLGIYHIGVPTFARTFFSYLSTR